MIIVCSEDRIEFGYGHRSRALALFDVFNALDIDFICVVTNNEWQKELNSLRIKTVRLVNCSGDLLEATELINQCKETIDSVKLFICDGNRFSSSYLTKIKYSFHKVVLIDDLGSPVRDEVDYVWNPNIYANQGFYDKWKTKNYYCGVQYLLLRKEFYQAEYKVEKKSVFISLGKASSKVLVSTIERVIRKLGFSVIISNNFTVNEMIKAIDDSYVTICGASVTLHEVWMRNAFALPVYQAADQIHFMAFLKSKGIHFLDILDNDIKKTEAKLSLIMNELNQVGLSNQMGEKPLKSLNNNSKDLIHELYY